MARATPREQRATRTAMPGKKPLRLSNTKLSELSPKALSLLAARSLIQALELRCVECVQRYGGCWERLMAQQCAASYVTHDLVPACLRRLDLAHQCAASYVTHELVPACLQRLAMLTAMTTARSIVQAIGKRVVQTFMHTQSHLTRRLEEQQRRSVSERRLVNDGLREDLEMLARLEQHPDCCILRFLSGREFPVRVLKDDRVAEFLQRARNTLGMQSDTHLELQSSSVIEPLPVDDRGFIRCATHFVRARPMRGRIYTVLVTDPAAMLLAAGDAYRKLRENRLSQRARTAPRR